MFSFSSVEVSLIRKNLLFRNNFFPLSVDSFISLSLGPFSECAQCAGKQTERVHDPTFEGPLSHVTRYVLSLIVPYRDKICLRTYLFD